MAQFARSRVQGRGCCQLLAQIRRGVDQEPMIAISADRDGCLRALESWMRGSCGPAHLPAAIPLWNATTCGRAQDDDAQHDPSPGISERRIFRIFRISCVSEVGFEKRSLEERCFRKLQRWT